GAELGLGGIGHREAVVFAAGCVTEGLSVEVASVTNELTEKDEPRVRPFHGITRLRDTTRDREPVVFREFADAFPAGASQESVFSGGSDGSAAGELDLEDRPRPHAPDLVRLRFDDLAAFIDSQDPRR